MINLCMPAVIFAYNRPEHLRQTLEALRRNDLAPNTPLVIYCDGPKNPFDLDLVAQVKDVALSAVGFASVDVRCSEQNQGLAASIISGVSQVLQDSESIIVLEDDVVTSANFLEYMNHSLELYEQEERVASIGGYIENVKGLPETFLLRKGTSWGWGTWRRVWSSVDWDGSKILEELEKKAVVGDFDFQSGAGFSKMLRNQVAGVNDSWAVRFYGWCFLQNMLHLLPGSSFVQNIGHDGSGTHCGVSNFFDIVLEEDRLIKRELITVNESEIAYQKISTLYQQQYGRYLRQNQPTWRRFMTRFNSLTGGLE